MDSQAPSRTAYAVARPRAGHQLRESGRILGTFGRHGRQAGQFHWVHNIAVDASGNIYTTEVDSGKRAQKFALRSRP